MKCRLTGGHSRKGESPEPWRCNRGHGLSSGWSKSSPLISWHMTSVSNGDTISPNHLRLQHRSVQEAEEVPFSSSPFYLTHQLFPATESLSFPGWVWLSLRTTVTLDVI